MVESVAAATYCCLSGESRCPVSTMDENPGRNSSAVVRITGYASASSSRSSSRVDSGSGVVRRRSLAVCVVEREARVVLARRIVGRQQRRALVPHWRRLERCTGRWDLYGRRHDGAVGVRVVVRVLVSLVSRGA
ncbi:hypothetical protein PINS_up022293 [Pythium insidiosum]|nr:hypothetical protein PINS_up022293 [Pythium insidiosum]